MGVFRWSGYIYCTGGEKTDYIGIDVHLKKCVATIKGKDRSIIYQTSFENNTKEISDFTQMVSKKYWPANAVCESTENYGVLPYDVFTDAGIKTKMANPRNTKIIAQAKLKDDKVDSEVLADLLRSDMISESYVPSNYYRDMRALVRGRLDLQHARVARGNHIHAIICEYPRNPETLCTIDADEINMRDINRQLVNTHRSTISTINKELASLENTIAQMALDDVRARCIMTIPKIRHITAITVLA